MGKVKDNNSKLKVILSDEARVNLESILLQLSSAFSDAVKFKIDDAANLLLSLRSYELSEKEIGVIRRTKFSPLDRAKWLLKQVENQQPDGDGLDFEKLVRQISKRKYKSKDNVIQTEMADFVNEKSDKKE